MIQGFHLRFTSEELRQHMVDRAAHHVARAIIKESEIPSLREVQDKIKAGTSAPEKAAGMGKFSNSTVGTSDVQQAIESLESEVRDHRNKSIVFKLFAEHLYAEDYDLQEADLVRLEILKR